MNRRSFFSSLAASAFCAAARFYPLAKVDLEPVISPYKLVDDGPFVSQYVNSYDPSAYLRLLDTEEFHHAMRTMSGNELLALLDNAPKKKWTVYFDHAEKE